MATVDRRVLVYLPERNPKRVEVQRLLYLRRLRATESFYEGPITKHQLTRLISWGVSVKTLPASDAPPCIKTFLAVPVVGPVMSSDDLVDF